MQVNMELLAACGLYCGACYHYLASQPGNDHLLTEEARGGRSLEGFTCRGCRSDQLYVHPGCRECAIRDCVEQRGLQHCGECPNMPCARLVAFQNDGRKHHLSIVDNLQALADQGPEAWLLEQAARWQCAECGTAFSWYERVCHSCGSVLSSYGDPAPVR